MQRSVWKVDSIRQLGYRRLRNVQKVVIAQYVDGTAHIAPQGHTLLGRRKTEAKSIDRPSRNVRPFIWPSKNSARCRQLPVAMAPILVRHSENMLHILLTVSAEYVTYPERQRMEEHMMPVVRVNDATFGDLSILKTWYGTKTPSETIDHVVREAMEQLGMERDDEPQEIETTTKDGAMQFETAPGLAFTKPLAASINGKSLRSPRWSAILLTMIAQVKAKGLDGDKLVRELTVPAKAEKYEDEGFKYHPDLGISVQGQSASDCWKEVDCLAKKWRIPVMVEFWWRQNPKAQYPGKTGMLRSGQA